jgi:3-isopropylmalate dehydrogenase
MQARIALLPGDGIGPEVTAEGVRALNEIGNLFGHTFSFQEVLIGGCAIEAYGQPLPEATRQACREAQAVLLGAVGGPQWSDPRAPVRPEQGLLELRSLFDLFANLRPVKVYPSLAGHTPLRPEVVNGTDILIVRELTGGLYYGKRQEETDGEAWDTMTYNRSQIERVARVAYRAAGLRRKRLTSVDKANVLASSRLWRRVVDELRPDFKEIEVEHALVDSCAMQLILKPTHYDVILAENLFGDILSDEAAVLAGSLGLLPSASLGEGTFGVYEPVHGSAPDIAGQSKANPTGTLLSCALLLRYSLGLETEAEALEVAVERAIEGGARTADLGGRLSTSAFTQVVLHQLSLSPSAPFPRGRGNSD